MNIGPVIDRINRSVRNTVEETGRGEFFTEHRSFVAVRLALKNSRMEARKKHQQAESSLKVRS